MTEKIIIDRLITTALDLSEHPADAVTALITAGTVILSRTFGEQEAIDLLQSSIAETRNEFVQPSIQ